MRKIDLIVIHCSATKPSQDIGASEIKAWHKARGWKTIGYHYVIRRNGLVERGRSVYQVGAHCAGYNQNSIGICYVGGLDDNGKPADTRTEQQKKALRQLVRELLLQFPEARVVGHRVLNPKKECPCFDVCFTL